LLLENFLAVKLPWDLGAVWRFAMVFVMALVSVFLMGLATVFVMAFVWVFLMGSAMVLVRASATGLVVRFSSGQHTKREKQPRSTPLIVMPHDGTGLSSLIFSLNDFFLLY
jgi:hypothetical protein